MANRDRQMSEGLDHARARRLLQSFSGRRILVLGDVMLDEFIWGRVARISPEAPVPVVEVLRESFHLGGAANVAANARSLGGLPILVGVTGSDAAGGALLNELRKAGVDSALVTVPGRPTTVKTRIVAHHQQVVRADREDSRDIAPAVEQALLRKIETALRGCSSLVVSDYQKGVVTRRIMRKVLSLALKRKVPVLVDPKVPHFPYYTACSLVTPNQLEAEQATRIKISGQDDVERAGQKILSLLKCRAALVTRGDQGMSLFERGRPPLHLSTAAREVFDVTGAGDTVIATLGLAMASGAALLEGAHLANEAAGIVVGKLGTATTTPDEILTALEAHR